MQLARDPLNRGTTHIGRVVIVEGVCTRTKDSITLTVKGSGIDMTVDLPPNISTQRLLEQLTPLLEKD